MEQREKVTAALEQLGISYRITEHPAVYTITESEQLQLPDGDKVAKNLFLRDDKKQHYYLAVLKKEKNANLRELRAQIGSRPLTFGSEDDLYRCCGLEKGAVTPFGALNDDEHRVTVVLAQELLAQELVGVHPNENTATLWIKPADLVRALEAHGTAVLYAAF